MSDKPLDTYIKSPPPVEPKSHYTYLEDQLSKLETVSKAHVVRIADDSAEAKALILQESTARVDGDAAQATYTNTIAAQTLASAQALVATETTARTSADSALASSITSLTATVGTNTAAITSEASTRATADTALGTRIDNLVLTNGSSAAVIIDEEATARISADLALGTRIDSLTATVSGNTSAISTEQTVRSTKDDALATQLFTMSSGSSRVYVATSAPSSTGRQPGDVWFDSDDSYKPYVWGRATPSATTGAYDWRDNSSGTYSNNVGNYAVYTQAISTLNTASSSQASSISALQTTVGNSSAGLVRDVSALTTTVGDTTSGLVRDVSSLTTVAAQQRIYRQNTQPSTSNRKVGDLWYDTGNGNTPYYWNGTSWIVNTDTTRSSQADLTTEQTVRANADSSLARYALTASAGTSRVYTADPGSTGRQNGDTWFKVDESFKPYVWYNSQWNDNSSGAYTQYIGQIASVTTTANAAYNNAATAQATADGAATSAGQAGSTANAANTTANTLSYEWSVVGTLDGAPAGSIRLLGASRTDPLTGVRSTASNLIIDANTTINGSLLVADSVSTNKIAPNAVTAAKLADGAVTALKLPDGVITNTKIADGSITTGKIAANAITSNLISAGSIYADKIVAGQIIAEKIADGNVINSKIADYAVTNSGGATANTTANVYINCRAGSRLCIVASGNAQISVAPGTNTMLQININNVMYNYVPFFSFAQGNGNYFTTPTSICYSYICPSTGTYLVSAGATMGGTVNLVCWEMAK